MLLMIGSAQPTTLFNGTGVVDDHLVNDAISIGIEINPGQFGFTSVQGINGVNYCLLDAKRII